MKFLIDAQLPARLAEFLNQAGHDAVHTVELPDGNRSTDTQIAQSADTEGRVVVTKDRDFRDGHLLAKARRQLLVERVPGISGTVGREVAQLVVVRQARPERLPWAGGMAEHHRQALFLVV